MASSLRTIAAAVMAVVAHALTVPTAQARPIVPAERRLAPFSGQVAACDDTSVISAIRERFQIRENQYWSSGLRMLDVDRVRDEGYRTEGYDLIPRRFCQARVAFNDRKFREMIYWIGEQQGFAGFGFGVEWCIQGLDRNYAFAPACRAARP